MIKQLLIVAALGAPSAIYATDFYITPDGNGAKDGTTWENAMGLTEFYEHMKFTFNQTPVNDSHTGEDFYFATGTYTFTSTIFVYRSGVSFNGGYDPTTGEAATTGRTIFDGNNKQRNNGAIFVQADTERNDAGKSRTFIVRDIDFTNFVTAGEWRGNDTNWQSGRPAAIYITKCGYAEITGCSFIANRCVGTGDNAMPGALSLNKVNALVSRCSFIDNTGNDGGAIKPYYNADGTWTKNVYLTVDRCYFTGNTSANRGGAIYGRNAMAVNIINSTINGNTAEAGGGVYSNGPGNYDQIVNIVSSTIAGNTADNGPEVGTNGNGIVNTANSIIVANGDNAPMADDSSTEGYTFLGNNVIGQIAEGYTATATDDISAANNYSAIFGANTLAGNGTLTPVTFHQGMAPADIASVVTSQAWNYAVDTDVDQIGNTRYDDSCSGALALDEITTGIDNVTVDNDNQDTSWYNLQGVRFNSRPTAKGLYIHKGKKVLVY